MNLLIVDDDRVDRLNTLRALRQTGWPVKVVEASSAEEGLNLARRGKFDIILLDYKLPTMNGLELLKLLRESVTNTSAVAMLSHSEDETLAIQCIEAGAQDFLAKSEVTGSRLLRAILQAKERYKYEQQLLKSHEQLRKLAEVDSLTGLANRYSFEKSLREALTDAETSGMRMALLVLDLDKFKQINDTMGHDAGDRLLQEVASRLRGPIREGDVLSRLGGDEYAILVKDIKSMDQVQNIVDRIIREFKKPMIVSGKDIVISTSIGIAVYPDSATDSIQLMKCADVAMYRSKEALGRNKFRFYSKSLHEKVHKRFELERELYRAVEGNEFELYYQPQFDPNTNKIICVEALIRWETPEHRIIPPNRFIPIAEEIGLIDKIGDWVIDEACKQLRNWRRNFNARELGFSIAINLSALQLNRKELFVKLVDAMAVNRIPPKFLELELTESAMNDSARAMNVLTKISDLGIKLALDDFGTGYSSLFQLQKYPFQVLKIDKFFIQSIPEADNDAKFLNAINAFAKTLDIEVVAEGVETKAQYNWCKRLHFNRVQGYYFGRPVQAYVFETLWLTKKPKQS